MALTTPVIIGISSVFLLSAIGGIVLFNNIKNRRERYVSIIARTTGGNLQDAGKNKSTAKHRADISKKLKQAQSDGQEKKEENKITLRHLMQQAGYEAPVTLYWVWSAVFTVVVYGLLMLTSWPGIAKILLTFTAFFGAPKFFLKRKAARRQRKFLEEFADAIDAMVRLLQAGMPMTEAIAMASREFTGPLKEEMTRVYENQKLGTPIGEASLMMARRIPLTEVHMFATALQIQSETGSSLSEVLSNLSAVIRARFRLRRKIQALSSEAKASAAIIGALPILVTLGLYAARPEYIGILFTVPKGKVLVAGATLWMGFGMLIMRQMINFRI